MNSFKNRTIGVIAVLFSLILSANFAWAEDITSSTGGSEATITGTSTFTGSSNLSDISNKLSLIDLKHIELVPAIFATNGFTTDVFFSDLSSDAMVFKNVLNNFGRLLTSIDSLANQGAPLDDLQTLYLSVYMQARLNLNMLKQLVYLQDKVTALESQLAITSR